jgi:hypothetical protein
MLAQISPIKPVWRRKFDYRYGAASDSLRTNSQTRTDSLSALCRVAGAKEM